MGYMHLNNLYKCRDILAFRRCYALEKVHGTSAHLSFNLGSLGLYSGGMNFDLFSGLFDLTDMAARLAALGHERVKVHGEAYGGKEQGMRLVYGPQPAFVVFDVLIGDSSLDVPKAEKVAHHLGLRFVPYEEGPTELAWVNEQRDRPSIVATWQGMGTEHMREGVVLRPPFEVRRNDGSRVMAKHKRDDFRETKTPRNVGQELEVLVGAQAIADEWVTPMRLQHVLQRFPEPHGIELTGHVCKAMVEDIVREANGEIVFSQAVNKAISRATAQLFKSRVTQVTVEAA